MLKAIFYARFHPERGPSVVHQYPNGSIIRPPTAIEGTSLITFSDISAYIIPPYELCNRALSICSNGHRVVGFPVSLEDPKYERNRFTFNVCFVLNEEDEHVASWDRLAQKTANFFTSLEEDDALLCAEEDLPGLRWAGDDAYPAPSTGIIHSLLETVVEDLNAYGETCARISPQHVLNLRLDLGVDKPQPPPIQAWQVPLIIRPLPSPDQWAWCMILQRIRPYIDGINHVKRIAELADVELKLTKRAIRELAYHDRIILLDIFHFQAIYTLTRDFTWFVQDEAMQAECRKYITIDPSTNPLATQGGTHETHEPTKESILDLYTSLSPGITLHEFVLTHQERLSSIDIRRFITFALIKGFVRRVHKYPFTLSPSTSGTPAFNNQNSGNSNSHSSPSKSKPKSNEDAVREFDRAWKKAALTSGWATPPLEPPPPPLPPHAVGSARSAEEVRTEEDERLRGFLVDGRCCLDEVCVEMRMSEKMVMERIRNGKLGEVLVLSK